MTDPKTPTTDAVSSRDYHCVDVDDPWQVIEVTDDAGKTWKLELDAGCIDIDDPGANTPCMVHGPENTSGTFFCVEGTGEIDGWLALPKDMRRWIDKVSADVTDWHSTQFDRIKAEAAAKAGRLYDAETGDRAVRAAEGAMRDDRGEGFNDREDAQ